MSIDRQQLKKIIEKDRGNNWWNPDLFEQKIKHPLPAELQIILPPPSYEKNYNCFVFAFGLQYELEFLGGKNPIQQEFIKYLIDSSILESTKNPDVGDVVFYRNDDDEITHAGIIKGKDEVLSKWMWGPLISHKLWDVPSSFGNEVLFFKTVEAWIIQKKYMEYSHSGVYIKPIG